MTIKEIKKYNFLTKVIQYVPEFEKIKEKNLLHEAAGEHYIMGLLQDLAEHSTNGNMALLKKIAIFLDKCWKNGEYEIHNAVMVSFFESLSSKTLKAIKKYLSPLLLEESEYYLEQWNAWRRTGIWKGRFTSKYDHYFSEEEGKKIREKLKRHGVKFE